MSGNLFNDPRICNKIKRNQTNPYHDLINFVV